MNLIYKPKGKAAEYAPLAINPYSGKCPGGCKYCYIPRIPDPKGNFKGEPRPKENYLEKLKADIEKLPERVPPVLFSFIGDPYQPIEEELRLVRKSILLLHEAGVPVMILTKFAYLAMRDFDLLTPHDFFGVTLTFSNPLKSNEWEPGANTPFLRIKAIREAKKRGIQTWVSLEPVIEVEETFELIRLTHEFVDLYRIGILNYHQPPEPISWLKFGRQVLTWLQSYYSAKYHIKNDLKKYIPRFSEDYKEYEFPEILDPPVRDPGRFKRN